MNKENGLLHSAGHAARFFRISQVYSLYRTILPTPRESLELHSTPSVSRPSLLTDPKRAQWWDRPSNIQIEPLFVSGRLLCDGLATILSSSFLLLGIQCRRASPNPQSGVHLVQTCHRIVGEESLNAFADLEFSLRLILSFGSDTKSPDITV